MKKFSSLILVLAFCFGLVSCGQKNAENSAGDDIKGKTPISATAKDEYGMTYTIKFDENGNKIYSENKVGDWEKWEYDENGNQTFYETSLGDWEKYEYDENGNKIYAEDVSGDWKKYEYDENGNQTYFENASGEWNKAEYDENGREIYYENSKGEIVAVEDSLGRVLASPSIGCPPAVPILVCGERITSQAIACFQYYGIPTVTVVKENIM